MLVFCGYRLTRFHLLCMLLSPVLVLAIAWHRTPLRRAGSLKAIAVVGDRLQPNVSIRVFSKGASSHLSNDSSIKTYKYPHALLTWANLEPSLDADTKAACKQYFSEYQLNRTAYVDVLHRGSQEYGADVCLSTQLSESRLDTFYDIAQAWEGPISAAIYVRTQARISNITHNIKNWVESHRRSNLHVHFVLPSGNLYPINYLRNVALRYAPCDIVFISDVDFMPSQDLYATVKNFTHQYFTQPQYAMTLLVVAAFETVSHNISVPLNKKELMQQWKVLHNVKPSHLTPQTINAQGPTDYNQWEQATKPYKVPFVEGYEPYVIVSKYNVPPFNELFLERYGDKNSFFIDLHSLGYEFLVLPNVFTVHKYHPATDANGQIFHRLGRCTLTVHNAVSRTAKENLKKLKTLTTLN